MAENTTIRSVPLNDGWFANEKDAKTLEGRLRPDLRDEGLHIVDDFFVKGSDNAPTNLSYVLGGYDGQGRIIGASMAQDDTFAVNQNSPLYERNLFLNSRLREVFLDILYVTKFSVAPENRGNGMGHAILSKTKFRGMQRGRITFLRTSRDNAHNWYSKFSDFHTQKGPFQVHVFSLGHVRPERYHEMLEKIDAVADYIAAKPITSIPVEQLGIYSPAATPAPYKLTPVPSFAY